VSWGNGESGSAGVISAVNSLIGSQANDQIGTEIFTLSNGNYVVASPNWDDAAINVGAVTFGSRLGGTVGVVAPSNSLVGMSPNDLVGAEIVKLEGGDSYIVISRAWDNGALTDAGAVSYGGTAGVRGLVNANNSVVGTVSPGGNSWPSTYDTARKQLIVGRPAANAVSILGDSLGTLFQSDFE
jgi:Repeat of unknown function (DUF5650)